MSCETPPDEIPDVPDIIGEETADPVEEAPFDPSSISPEVKKATMIDIRAFIEMLNGIIQARDYDSWLLHLTDEYIAHYSSSEVLAELSESTVLKRAGIVLQTLRDYFLYVVYPSRQHDRVDDIEFISPTKIRAITISPKGERLVLYNLEKVGDTWKIGIGR